MSANRKIADTLIRLNLQKPSSECKCCGLCCQAFDIKVSYKDIIEIAKMESTPIFSDYGFASRNFIPLSEKEAFEINPYLKIAKTLFSYNSSPQEHHYYTCLVFNSKANKCGIHKYRPHICRGFPWYDGKPYRQPLYSPNCAYHEDLKKII